MKISRPLILILIVLALLTSTLTWASHGRSRHHTHIGIHFAAPLVFSAGYAVGQTYYPYSSYYSYSPYYPVRPYYPPPVHFYQIAPSSYLAPDLMSSLAMPTYIERTVQQEEAEDAVQDHGAYWYYCHNPKGYYPNVAQCASGWQRVAPQP